MKWSHPQTESALEIESGAKALLQEGSDDEWSDPCREHMELAGLRPQGDLHVTPCGLSRKTYANENTSLRLRQLVVVCGGQITCDMDEFPGFSRQEQGGHRGRLLHPG